MTLNAGKHRGLAGRPGYKASPISLEWSEGGQGGGGRVSMPGQRRGTVGDVGEVDAGTGKSNARVWGRGEVRPVGKKGRVDHNLYSRKSWKRWAKVAGSVAVIALLAAEIVLLNVLRVGLADDDLEPMIWLPLVARSEGTVAPAPTVRPTPTVAPTVRPTPTREG